MSNSKHVFISYVREDEYTVRRLRAFLENLGIEVWIDKKSLIPGRRWKLSINEAIKQGAFFIVCFSANYNKRNSTYMNEELIVAIESLRLKPHDTSWFIPIRLTDCEIPNRPIGAGETLSDIQHIDLFPDFEGGLEKLAETLLPALRPEAIAKATFEEALKQHVTKKITYFQNAHVVLFQKAVDKWLELLEKRRLDNILENLTDAWIRSQSIGKHQLEQLIEPEVNGKAIFLSVVPNRNIAAYIEALNPSISETGHKYIDFIIEKRRLFRKLNNWEDRDFIHIILFDEGDEMTIDILFFEAFNLRLGMTGYLVRQQESFHKSGEQIAIIFAMMYPTSILSAGDAGILRDRIDNEDVKSKSNK